MNPELKKHLVSAGITFFAGFALMVVPELDNISMQSFENGALGGILFAGVRTGLKMLLESFIVWYNDRQGV